MARLSKRVVWAELARRKKAFHPNTDWNDIRLFGLFNWGEVSHMLKTGELVTHMKKENKIIWVCPSPAAYEKHVEPLLKMELKELEILAGWHI